MVEQFCLSAVRMAMSTLSPVHTSDIVAETGNIVAKNTMLPVSATMSPFLATMSRFWGRQCRRFRRQCRGFWRQCRRFGDIVAGVDGALCGYKVQEQIRGLKICSCMGASNMQPPKAGAPQGRWGHTFPEKVLKI